MYKFSSFEQNLFVEEGFSIPRIINKIFFFILVQYYAILLHFPDRIVLILFFWLLSYLIYDLICITEVVK